MSASRGIIPLSINERLKMTNYELKELAESLAKENYEKDKYAALWGAASVLLSVKDLQIVVKVMGNK